MKTFSEYELAALRTAPIHTAAHEIQAREHDVAHAIMGLCTESAELLDVLKKNHAYGKPIDFVNFREEIGDALWYVPLICRGLGWRLASLVGTNSIKEFTEAWAPFNRHTTINALTFALMKESAGLIGIEVTRLGAFKENYELLVRDIICLLSELAYAAGSSLETCATVNIQKLQARYPEKFTSDAALNRDLVKERAVLEGKGCECKGDCEHCEREGA